MVGTDRRGDGRGQLARTDGLAQASDTQHNQNSSKGIAGGEVALAYRYG